MAWIVWIPPSDSSDGELFYASKEADSDLLRWSNDLKAKKTFIVFLEVMALAAPYFSPGLHSTASGFTTRSKTKETVVFYTMADKINGR